MILRLHLGGPKEGSGPQTGCEMGTAWSMMGRQPNHAEAMGNSPARTSLTWGAVTPGAHDQEAPLSAGLLWGGGCGWRAVGEMETSAQEEEEEEV